MIAFITRPVTICLLCNHLILADMTFECNFCQPQLLLKTTMPFVAVALLWLFPLCLFLAGKEHTEVKYRAARLSLLGLELVCPSTTSTIIRTFDCTRFDNGDFLRANLSLPCDNSPTRKWWKYFAWLMLAAYPLGGACSLRDRAHPSHLID